MSSRKTRNLRLKHAVWLSLWGGAVYGVLQVHTAKGFLAEYSICGPWGCGPPIKALISYHGFWYLLLIPVSFVLSRVLPTDFSIATGRRILWIGIMGVIGYTAWNSGEWVRKTGESQYLFRHALFSLLVIVDIPILQILLASACLRRWASRRRRTRTVLARSQENDARKILPASEMQSAG